jgi:hypothetical protein
MERPADDFIRSLLALKARPTPIARRDSPVYTPLLSREEWDAIFETAHRGVQWREIFASLPEGKYATLKSLQNAASRERIRRKEEK